MAIEIYLYMYRENQRRDREAVALAPGSVSSSAASGISKEEREAIEKGMLDCTELDDPGFRYTL
jgi:hypothetical protein